MGCYTGLYKDAAPMMKNQMEKNMDNEMASGVCMWVVFLTFG